MSHKSDEVIVCAQYYDLGLSSREQIASKILAAILSNNYHLNNSKTENIEYALEYTDLLLAKTRELK